jgi:hypothetical protein
VRLARSQYQSSWSGKCYSAAGCSARATPTATDRASQPLATSDYRIIGESSAHDTTIPVLRWLRPTKPAERLRPSSKSTPRLNCRPRSRRLYWILGAGVLTSALGRPPCITGRRSCPPAWRWYPATSPQLAGSLACVAGHIGGGEICVGLDAIHGGIAAAPSNAKHPGQRSLRTLDAFNLLPGALTSAWL